MTLIDLPTVATEWDDMDGAAQAAHREECPDLCAACEPYRLFGVCPCCGPDQEGNTDEQCLQCGWPLVPGWWRDA
jgi:hypothetical protein